MYDVYFLLHDRAHSLKLQQNQYKECSIFPKNSNVHSQNVCRLTVNVQI